MTMTIIELTTRKHGKVTGREACRIENEGVTLTGQYSTRADELTAAGYEVTRTVRRNWPAWYREVASRLKRHRANP